MELNHSSSTLLCAADTLVLMHACCPHTCQSLLHACCLRRIQTTVGAPSRRGMAPSTCLTARRFESITRGLPAWISFRPASPWLHLKRYAWGLPPCTSSP